MGFTFPSNALTVDATEYIGILVRTGFKFYKPLQLS